MLTEFKLPGLGENIKGGTVVKIIVSVGSAVKKDQPVLELETDKATIEVPSPLDGIVKEILVKEGAVANVGQLVMKFEAGAAAAEQPKAPAKEEKKEAPKPAEKSHAPAAGQAARAATAPAAAASQPGKEVSAAPSVRRFAREIGIDVTQVPGSGPGGRISVDDVKAYSKALNTGAARTGSGPAVQPLPDFTRWGQVERKPMNNIRRKTAEHLSHAWLSIPHVTQFDKADITNLEKLRKQLSTPARKLTITPFIMKVMAAALKQFPQFNSSIDMARSELVYKNYFHIGVAVDTDRGLIVPVIRDVDQKSIYQLADELTGAAERARTKKTTIEEMQGGCMTITNLGGIGGVFFTPIVNWPEVAILGVSRAQMEPGYENNICSPRLMLPLSLSYDHRVIDGADGARFLRWVCNAIEQPFLLKLEDK
ncbi:MAG: 2-oxo acid dehydrogenase subunit E2 [Candidatus Omnitrophota bacterium]|nr:2-oxo acid dehydrogenase subunit E2 [Candidatus Omnitrophota bacterium]MDZ4243442.1 2-oxo acid dehydrogenase subunit E2 [Candidatus Omnitrophota bacterium]